VPAWLLQVRLSLWNPLAHIDLFGGIVSTTNGDITSLTFNGKQLQDSSEHTQLSSGLGKCHFIVHHGSSQNFIGSATVTSSVANNIATVTIRTSTIVCNSQVFSLYMIKISSRHTIILSEVAKTRCILGLSLLLSRPWENSVSSPAC
jgi:hypothetical protein